MPSYYQRQTHLTVSGKEQKMKSMWDQNNLNNLLYVISYKNIKRHFETDKNMYTGDT